MDSNEPNTFQCKKSLFLFHYPVCWFPTCIPWSPAEAFCILSQVLIPRYLQLLQPSIKSHGTHQNGWWLLTFSSGIQQAVSDIPVVIYMQLKKSISKFLTFCDNNTRVIFIFHKKNFSQGTAVCLPFKWSYYKFFSLTNKIKHLCPSAE